MPKSKKELVDDNGIDELMVLVQEETKLEHLKHKHRIDEIDHEFERKKELSMTKFDHELQIQRIRNAEIKKSQQRKADMDFMGSYSK